MNKFILSAAALLLASVAPAPGSAQEAPGELGLGVYIGTPFGFSGKYLLDRDNAVDVALGAQGSHLDVHGDFLTHFRELLPQPKQGRFAPYIGLGLKLENKDDAVFGIRFLGGLAYSFGPSAPLELFAELAPVLRLAPSTGSNLDGGVGLRYYFGGGGSRRGR